MDGKSPLKFSFFSLIVYACTKSQLVAHYRAIVSRSCLECESVLLAFIVILLLRSLCRRAHTSSHAHTLITFDCTLNGIIAHTSDAATTTAVEIEWSVDRFLFMVVAYLWVWVYFSRKLIVGKRGFVKEFVWRVIFRLWENLNCVSWRI